MKSQKELDATNKWRKNNRERIREYMKKWRAENSERLKKYDSEYKASHKSQRSKRFKEWSDKNRDSLLVKKSEYAKKRYSSGHRWRPKTKAQKQRVLEWSRKYLKHKRLTDPNHRIAHNLRTRLRSVLDGKSKSKQTLQYLGCDAGAFRRHLESQFSEEMSWDNYGSFWHIDHIVECFRFDLTKESEIEKCFHFSNLRPLDKKENMSRSANAWRQN